MPDPHDLVQALHAAYAETVQWTGHVPSEQALLAVNSEHTAPPRLAPTMTVRLRDCEPALHDAEQGPHSAHGDRTQSCGQPCALHACTSEAASHALPPNAPDMTRAHSPPHDSNDAIRVATRDAVRARSSPMVDEEEPI